jgi:iron complex transport system substrate-binding protein
MSRPATRIVSLLPAATEIVCALGIADRLVGRSHECDEPPHVAALPALTTARIDPAAPSRQIHEQVGRALNAGGADERAPALYTLDAAALAALAPDLVLTQAACDVCAISTTDVQAAVQRAGGGARIVSLAPTTLEGVFADILTIGAATDTLARAREVIARLRARCDSVSCRTEQLVRRAAGASPSSAGGRPRVALIEWLDPPMAAGNWVPEMVALAGGTDVLGRRGDHSHWITWADVAAADPDVVALIPCGFTLDRVVAEAASPAVHPHLATLRATREGRLWAVDGHHLFNRPGPRLVESLEVLAEILHPGAFSFAATRRFARRIAAG